MTRSLLLLPILALAAPTALAATSSGYDTLSFREPTSSGLEVQPPLDEFRAVSGARVIVPEKWTELAATRSGRPRYMTAGNANCRFRVTWTVRSVVADGGSADAQLDAAIAAPPRAHVYEEGARNGRPWRVVKVAGGANAGLRGAWVGILTRRKDVAPAGKTVWTHITADARARSGDECHSGTVHAAARDIADGLSVASNSLRFVER